MDNILDHVVVQGQRYDIVSPTAFGDNIETIGSACINPDGYAQGSTFLARLGNEQFYYEATAAITQGSSILEGTNCKKTTVTGREAELASEIETLGETVDSLNEALSDEVATRAELGAHNLLENLTTTQTLRGITQTVNADGSLTYSGSFETGYTYVSFTLNNKQKFKKGNYKLSGAVSANANIKVTAGFDQNAQDFGNGANLSLASDSNTAIYCFVTITNAVTLPLTIKPMIRLASDTDPTYQPYAMTNQQLTDAVGVKTLTPILNSIYFNDASYISCYQIGKLVMVNVAGSTIAQIPNGNIDLTTDANLPAPIDGNYIRGFMWDATNKAILGQVRIEGKKINFPFNSAVPSGTSIRINFSYVAQ